MQFTIRSALTFTAIVAAAIAFYLWVSAPIPTRVYCKDDFGNRPEHIKAIAQNLPRFSGKLTLEQFGKRIHELGFTSNPKPLNRQGCKYHWAIKPSADPEGYTLTAAFLPHYDDPLRYATISVIDEQTGTKNPIWHAEYFNPNCAKFEDILPQVNIIQNQNWTTIHP